VDLGGWQAVANPLRVPLTGVAAKVVTRGYHLYALPANRLRVATDWFNDIVEHRQFVRLGLIQPDRSGLAVAEQTDIYYRTDGQPLDHAAVPPAPDAASP
jgi:NADH dehydrogenase